MKLKRITNMNKCITMKTNIALLAALLLTSLARFLPGGLPRVESEDFQSLEKSGPITSNLWK